MYNLLAGETFGWGNWVRTSAYQSQSLMPYHLAMPQKWWKKVESNHRTRRNRFTVCRVWPLRYSSSRASYRRVLGVLIRGGCYRTRTYDLRRVKAMLSQLS